MVSTKPTSSYFAGRAVSYAFWFTTTLSLAVGILLLVLDDKSPAETKLSAVGSGIVGAAVFGALVTLFVNRESRLLLESALATLFEDQRQALLTAMTHASQMHLPDREYPATDGFDPVFMRDFMKDLQTSTSIEFRGSTAKWLPLYVGYCRKGFERIDVVMLDPRDLRALRRRAADRLLLSRNAGQSVETLVEALRSEIATTLIGLFDLRDNSSVRVAFDSSQVSVSRIERTDEALYLAFYQPRHGHPAVNPTTYRYARGSFPYEIYSLELARHLEFATHSIAFDSRTTEEQLTTILADVGLADLSERDIQTARVASARLQDWFATKMAEARRNE
jgi:hypothetical protein